ncbi:MAG TPA: PhzF family phenazine biosynthesis protein [Luteibacter sp.]|jgi:PhzF family phenazine biosynthesis protein|nr:PhzF family phenazine biosynthesis protein [Luteibacter sp.]
MKRFPFRQVDVFASEPTKGNALAVVFDADALSDAKMAVFANWTNLSETVFLLEPTTSAADYRVRIFTTEQELPFAGHPTIGSCHAWLEAGGRPRGTEIVQECGAGLVRIRRDGDRLAFAAPPLLRDGPVDEDLLGRIVEGLGVEREAIVASAWVDNGPGWVAVMLRDRADVLALVPDYTLLKGLRVGVVAPWGGDVDFEVRAFLPGDGMPEDPVTGSLNAGIAQWLIGAGIAPDRYVVSQGTVLGRSGRVYVERIGADIWIGGNAITCIEGSAML